MSGARSLFTILPMANSKGNTTFNFWSILASCLAYERQPLEAFRPPHPPPHPVEDFPFGKFFLVLAWTALCISEFISLDEGLITHP